MGKIKVVEIVIQAVSAVVGFIKAIIRLIGLKKSSTKDKGKKLGGKACFA